jgi:hypothetical protein
MARLKGLYRHRTTQYIITKANIHAPMGIQTRDPSNQKAKTYALDRATTRTVRKIKIQGLKLTFQKLR